MELTSKHLNWVVWVALCGLVMYFGWRLVDCSVGMMMIVYEDMVNMPRIVALAVVADVVAFVDVVAAVAPVAVSQVPPVFAVVVVADSNAAAAASSPLH